MTSYRQKPCPSQRDFGATTLYTLALGRLAGVCFILTLTVFAGLLTHLPLPSGYVFTVGYGLGITLFLTGALLATSERAFGKALLGGGAACLFLTATRMLFNTSQQALPFRFPLHPYGGLLLCAALLLLFATLSWRTASQSNSLLTVGLALFLVHTAAPLLSQSAVSLMLLLGVVGLIVWLWLWFLRRPEMLFPYCALILAYAAFYLFGRAPASQDSLAAACIAVGLAILYAAETTLIVSRALRVPGRDRFLLPLAVINILLYVAASVVLFAPEHDGMVWMSLGVAFVACAVAAPTLYFTQGNGALVSLFSCVAVVALLACFLLPLRPAFRLMALASGCVAPALLSRWRNDKLLRITEYGLLFAVFVGSFSLNGRTDYFFFGPATLPVYWVWLILAAAMLCLAARLHTCWIYDAYPGQKAHEPNIARTRYHSEHELLALVCAFTATLMIALHTILMRGDSDALPLILSAQGMFFLGIGLVLFTPAIAFASLGPIIAAHALFYAFPYVTMAVPPASPDKPLMLMLALSAATAVPALYADRRLSARAGHPPRLAEILIAAAPYVPAAALLLLALHRTLPIHYLPALLGMTAFALLLPRALRYTKLPGMSALGYVVAVVSGVVFLLALRVDTPLPHVLGWYPFLLGLYVFSLLLIERVTVCRVLQGRWATLLVSHAIICAAVVVGALGLYQWNSGPVFVLALMGQALLLAIFGGCVRVKAYYHIAVLLIAFAVGYALLSGIGRQALALHEPTLRPPGY